MRKLSFVIPCYRSEHTIETVVEELIETVQKRKDYDYEVILVNDYSPDKVWDVIRKLCMENSRIKGINLARNFGQHAAVMAGYRACSGELIISLDDDGQTPVDEVYRLIDKIDEGYDVVFAEYDTIKQNIFRRFGTFMNDMMMRTMLQKPKNIKTNSYCVARKFVIDEVLRYGNSYPFVVGLILRTTRKIADVKVKHRKRIEGESGYTFRSLLKLWFNGFTTFSEKPLRIATILGLVCALLGFGYSVYIVVRKLLYPEIILMGYSSLMAVLLFIGGMLMLLLGIIGEYVGRIYITLNNAPQYVVRDVINVKQEETQL